MSRFDPFSLEIQELCWARKVNPVIVFAHIKKYVIQTIDNKMNVKSEKARDNLINYLIENEYEYSLKCHISLVDKKMSSEEFEKLCVDDDRIKEMQEKHKGKWGDETDHEAFDDADDRPEIDKPIAVGGLTRLHIASQMGELDEVKMLIEDKNADPHVLCNSKMKAIHRARDMGCCDVVDYLAQFEQARCSTDGMAQSA